MAYHAHFITCTVTQQATVRFDNQVWAAQGGKLDGLKGRRVTVRPGALGYEAAVVRQADRGAAQPWELVAELYPVESGARK